MTKFYWSDFLLDEENQLFITSLSSFQPALHQYGFKTLLPSKTYSPLPYEPGSLVLIKSYRRNQLAAVEQDPFPVLLSTPTPIKLPGMSS
jgi:hypothetical protein